MFDVKGARATHMHIAGAGGWEGAKARAAGAEAKGCQGQDGWQARGCAREHGQAQWQPVR